MECFGETYNLSIKNKHIILGYGTDIIQEQFRHIKGTHVDFKNDCIFTVAYIIYKYWLSSLNNERKKERRSLISLVFQSSIIVVIYLYF